MQSSWKRTLATYAVLVFSIPILYGGCNPCGNGKLDPGEQCDDGNQTSMDGCSRSCKIETATTCVATTWTAMQAEVAKDATWSAWHDTVIPGYNLDLTSGVHSVYACSEGYGTTTYFARIKSTRRHTDDGWIIYRPDFSPGFRISVEHSTNALNQLLIRQGPVDLKIANPTTAPVFTLYNALTGDVIPEAAALTAAAEPAPFEAQSAGPMVGPDGPNPPPADAPATDGPTIKLVPVPTTAAVTVKTEGMPILCNGYYQDHENCLHTLYDVGHMIGVVFDSTALYLVLSNPEAAPLDVGVAVGAFFGVFYETGKCAVNNELRDDRCWTEDCKQGHCNGFGDLISGLRGCAHNIIQPGIDIGAQLCDLSCQTCELRDRGDGPQPSCIGLTITNVVPTGGGDVVDSYFCPVTNTGDVTVSYCGRPNGYIASATQVKAGTQPTGGCPIGWTCSGGGFADFFSPDNNPVVDRDVLSCCSNGASLPVTFHSVVDVFDWWNSDFADYDWRCVSGGGGGG